MTKKKSKNTDEANIVDENTDAATSETGEQVTTEKPIFNISPEALARQEKRRARVKAFCVNLRSQKVSMNTPELLETLLDYVESDDAHKKDFVQFLLKKKYDIQI